MLVLRPRLHQGWRRLRRRASAIAIRHDHVDYGSFLTRGHPHSPRVPDIRHLSFIYAPEVTTNKEPSRNSVIRFNRAVKQPHKVTRHFTAFSNYTIRTIFFILHLGLWLVSLDGISLETSILYQYISFYFVIVHGLLTTWNLLRARGPSVRYLIQINLPLSNPPSRS
jgi:hypothetical protein